MRRERAAIGQDGIARGRLAIALGRPLSNGRLCPLVELGRDLALHVLLARIAQRPQHAPLGRLPEASVDQLRMARHQLVLQVRGQQDRAARRLDSGLLLAACSNHIPIT